MLKSTLGGADAASWQKDRKATMDLELDEYQPMRSYRFWTAEALEDLREAAAREDFACYVLDGQVFPLEEYLEVVPEREANVRKLIRDGKLVIGPFYTQFDEWLPSAENMIRNCLFGSRSCARYGGGIMRAGYLPDNFGHPRQLPQILTNFGLDSLLFMRGMPELPEGHPDEFLYEGIDGSRVLASHFRESYAGAFDMWDKPVDPITPRSVPYYEMPEYGERGYLSFEFHKELAVHDDPERVARSMIRNVSRIKDRYPSGVVPLIAGFDHLPPQIAAGDSVRAANEMQDGIEFVMGSAEDYVRAVRLNLENPAVYSRELLGSRYQYVLLGALSTRSYLKRQNFACETLLEKYAEPLAALALEHGGEPRSAPLGEAWRNMLINSAHDSIHGSSTDEVHIETEARFAASRQIAAGIVHESLGYLSRHIRRWWEGSGENARGILVYAPVSGSQPVELWLPAGEKTPVIRGRDGQILPVQTPPRPTPENNGIGLPRNGLFPDAVYRNVLFMAELAAGGVESFAMTAAGGAGIPPESPLTAGENYLENEFVKVTADRALIHLFDKETGAAYYNLNLLEEEADAGDVWDYSPPWTPGSAVLSSSFDFKSKLTERGPVRASLEVSGAMAVPARLCGDRRSDERVRVPVVFTVSVYRGLRRADVSLRFDNAAEDHRIRLCVPTGIRADKVLSQGQLALIERPIGGTEDPDKWLQPPTRLLPFREWAAVSGAGRGLAVAFKGVYDYEAENAAPGGGAVLRFTLLRGVGMMGRENMPQRMGGASWAIATPGAQCRGVHRIEFSYLPFTPGEEDRAPFLPLAQGFLCPPAAHLARSAPAEPVWTLDGLPPRFAWREKNIQFSAYKPCEDGDGFILRLYENQGRPAEVALTVGRDADVRRSDMNESEGEPLENTDGAVRLRFGPYKAETIKIRYQG